MNGVATMTPAQRDRMIVQMAQAGRRPAEIQRDLGLPYKHTVNFAITSARKRGVSIPSFPRGPREQPSPPPKSVSVPADIMRRLGQPALERGISTPELVRRLLAVCANEPDLTYAILDDAP